MDGFDAFFMSPENQEKFGFTCSVWPGGSRKIVYDGNMDYLLNLAYEAAGYEYLESVSDDPRPRLELDLKDSGEIVLKGTDEPVKIIVDGEGDEPNFALDFIYNGSPMQIRFSLIEPKLYPDDYDCPFIITMSTLSVVNEIMRQMYTELIDFWNGYRFKDLPAVPGFYPNYRAINQINR